jgi:hypothetical protein
MALESMLKKLIRSLKMETPFFFRESQRIKSPNLGGNESMLLN